jgi:hypothetical protein
MFSGVGGLLLGGREMAEKTHYRKVFKSDHLGVADLEDLIEAGTKLNFTIKHVKQEYGVAVAGRKGDFNIAYFVENIKPLVLNATNSKVMKKITGSAFVEDWNNIFVALYIDPSTKLKGEIVGGVRINPTQPKKTKSELLPGTTAWKNAVAAYHRDGNLDKVKERMIISEENEQLLIDEAVNGVG